MKLSNQNEAQLVARIEDLKADLALNFGQICELLTQIKSHYLHKDPMFKWYREVGTGKLLPETVMTFARKPDYLKHLCGYSRETQMSITRCNEFNWCEEFRGEIVEKRTDWKKMSSAAFKRMFPIGGPVRKTITTDQGGFYIPKTRLSEMSPEVLKNKAEDWGSTEENPTVPPGVRFLIGTADVQKNAFVCQVNGFTESGDMVIVDGFKIRLSNRRNSNDERLPIDPAAFAGDWDVLETELMNKTYELADGSGRRMRLRAVASDSGGAEGVTGHAYNFWRKLKGKQDGSHRRFILVKGDTTKGAPRARTTWPDASKKDKLSVARGDVPVVMLQSNSLKDLVYLLMARRVAEESQETQGGMLRYPDWLENWFYVQLTSELRSTKGWENTRKRRNESFDLSYYAQGIALRPVEAGVPYVHFGADRLDFNAPPIWAADWDENEFVFDPATGEADAGSKKRKRRSLAEIAQDFGLSFTFYLKHTSDVFMSRIKKHGD